MTAVGTADAQCSGHCLVNSWDPDNARYHWECLNCGEEISHGKQGFVALRDDKGDATYHPRSDRELSVHDSERVREGKRAAEPNMLELRNSEEE